MCPEKRSTFCQTLEVLKQEETPIVFIYESGFAHSMPRTHGYAKGDRCYGLHDWRSKGITNVIGALISGTLLTVNLFNTIINTEIFNSWGIQDLIPKLPSRTVVVMDNAAFHKGKDMQQAIQKSGHTLLYMPP